MVDPRLKVSDTTLPPIVIAIAISFHTTFAVAYLKFLPWQSSTERTSKASRIVDGAC